MNDIPTSNTLLQRLEASGWVDRFAIGFGKFLERLDPDIEPLVQFAGMQAAMQANQGHVCIELADFPTGQPLLLDESTIEKAFGFSPEEWPYGVTPEEWIERLKSSNVVTTEEVTPKPLMLDETYDRLYVYRYWLLERELSSRILERVRKGYRKDIEDEAGTLARESNDWFTGTNTLPNWQKVAAATALSRYFSVITGGPGTGKTTSVLTMMAMMIRHHQLQGCNDEPPSIALAAPTGKAAARLNESIQEGKNRLAEIIPESVLAQLPAEAGTIHRLLGTRRFHPEFRYNRNRKLPHDMVIVDEASMIDLPLMSRLVEALKPETQLVLLGDKNQLASVEAGRVLGDICAAQELNNYSPEYAGYLRRFNIELHQSCIIENGNPLLDSIVELTQTWRFSEERGIGQLAKTIQTETPDVEQVLETLKSDYWPEVSLLQADREQSRGEAFEEAAIQFAKEFYSPLLNSGSVEEAFRTFHTFQILCAHRFGPWGVREVNRLVEYAMGKTNSDEWYHGKPVMVTENDYTVRLYNGDLGIALDPERLSLSNFEADTLLIAFEAGVDENGNPVYRWLAPERLPANETAYATTIHKSQGSEFNEVFCVLPDQITPIVTRELIYTALTRAKEHFTLWSTDATIKEGLKQRVKRTSGFSDRLWSD